MIGICDSCGRRVDPARLAAPIVIVLLGGCWTCGQPDVRLLERQHVAVSAELGRALAPILARTAARLRSAIRRHADRRARPWDGKRP